MTARDLRWVVEMEIQTQMGQRALYKIPIWSKSETTARHDGAKHANDMQSDMVKVRNVQVYPLLDHQIVLPGLYPMEQRHHLKKDPVQPFDSVENVASFEQSLKKDYLRNGKFGSFCYDPSNDDHEVETTQLFDSLETDDLYIKKSKPFWKKFICCFSNEKDCGHTRVPLRSW